MCVCEKKRGGERGREEVKGREGDRKRERDRESPLAVQRTEKLWSEEDGFKSSVIKAGECVTIWLRVVSHADLETDQSRLVRRPLSLVMLC